MRTETDLAMEDAGPSLTPASADELRAKHRELLRALATVLGMRNPPGGMVGEIHAQIAELENTMAAEGAVPAHALRTDIKRGL